MRIGREAKKGADQLRSQTEWPNIATPGIHIKMPRQAIILIINFTHYSSAFYLYFYSILS